MSLFFFSSRRRHTRWPRDWSSDVCSSDLMTAEQVNPLNKRILGIIRDTNPERLVVIAGEDYSGAHTLETLEVPDDVRSEERRVGKECRARRAGERWKKK